MNGENSVLGSAGEFPVTPTSALEDELMASFVAPDFISSAEAHRARSRHSEPPPCDGLRLCAALMAVTQYLMTTGVSEVIDLGLVVQAEFALTGFLLAGFLIRDRSRADSPGSDGLAAQTGVVLRTLPSSYLFAFLALVLLLPRVLVLESVPVPDLNELPALILANLNSVCGQLLRGSADGSSLIAWPLALLFVPRRWIGVAFLAVLGSGLTVQFAALISGEAMPASILVAPSPLDLLAAGALMAAMTQGMGKSGNGQLARWAMLMGLVLATASIGLQSRNSLTNWGATTLLSAPAGFGAINFILKIMATTLVGSLAWRSD